MTDRAFTAFPFNATGTSTPRTMPDRLRERKNVKDYGALGNSTNGTDGADDTAAIQAAINDTSPPFSTNDRGTIFFPPGMYRVTGSLAYELSAGIIVISFLGYGAVVVGSIPNDAIFKRSVNSPVAGPISFEGLQVKNTNPTGKGILFHSTIGSTIRNCYVNAFIGIETFNSQSVTINSCAIIRDGSLNSSGSVGIVAGNATTCIACDITSYEHGVRAQNAGFVFQGGRLEVNTVGIFIGLDETGSQFQCTSFNIAAPSMESNGSGIVVWGGAGGSIQASVSGVRADHVMAYGIRIIGGNDIAIAGTTVSITGAFDVAGISVEGGDRISMQSVTSPSWNVNTAVDTTQWDNIGGLDLARTVANLPASPTRGMRYTVTDGTNGLAVGAVLTNTGTHTSTYLVWYNGTNWTVIGK